MGRVKPALPLMVASASPPQRAALPGRARRLGPLELGRKGLGYTPVERILSGSRLLALQFLGDVGVALLAQLGHFGLELLAIGAALGDRSAELLARQPLQIRWQLALADVLELLHVVAQ